MPKIRTGLQLLSDTLKDETPNSKALGRVLKAMDKGTLSVNGQRPDEAYSIGEYLIHGGRIKFDVSDLSRHQQTQFFKYISNEQAQARTFATHRAGGIDASGSPAEAKSGILGAIGDFFRSLAVAIGFAESKHYGINLAIGGRKISNAEGKNQGLFPEESGEWGHMYMHKDSNLLLVGIEPSGPGASNKRTKEAHSKTGASGEFSPFMEQKINSEALQQQQIKLGKSPLSIKEKYNWATIKITAEQLDALRTGPDIGKNNALLVEKKPANAALVKDSQRVEKMKAWAKATKNANKTSVLAKIIGGLLVTAGMIVALVPIPVVTQVLGGGIVSLGVGITAGVVGLGLMTKDIRGPASAAEKQYAKNLKKIKTGDAINTEGQDSAQKPDSTQTMVAIMGQHSPNMGSTTVSPHQEHAPTEDSVPKDNSNLRSSQVVREPQSPKQTIETDEAIEARTSSPTFR